jgi:hypothetical protein
MHDDINTTLASNWPTTRFFYSPLMWTVPALLLSLPVAYAAQVGLVQHRFLRPLHFSRLWCFRLHLWVPPSLLPTIQEAAIALCQNPPSWLANSSTVSSRYRDPSFLFLPPCSMPYQIWLENTDFATASSSVRNPYEITHT